ncbi:hypothetical protein TNCV_2310451 [Trichonephila clavipes]|nr:hypothetical protein TNCV_2310451 [Trichonephila clavipes]
MRGGGIDHLDHIFSFYRMKHRSKKWAERVILQMINFTMLSAWLEYRRGMTELGEPEKDFLDYFAFRLSTASTLIHGLLKKPSPTPSLAEDENNEPPRKSRLAFHIKCIISIIHSTC